MRSMVVPLPNRSNRQFKFRTKRLGFNFSFFFFPYPMRYDMLSKSKVHLKAHFEFLLKSQFVKIVKGC